MLTSTVAPSFWMPAVVLGKDWGTATLGTTATFAPGVTGYATVTGQIGEKNLGGTAVRLRVLVGR